MQLATSVVATMCVPIMSSHETTANSAPTTKVDWNLIIICITDHFWILAMQYINIITYISS